MNPTGSDLTASGDAPTVCAACAETFTTRYCGACGERRPSPDDERLGPFLREQFQEVTSADGKLWATIKALFVPGKLTEEYFAGRRGRFVRPVRIFLVANVLFFLSLTALGATSSLLGRADVQREAMYYGTWATAQLAAAAADSGVSQEVYDAAFDRRSGALATSLVGLMVPAFALVIAVALFWRRASGVRHLVFATHYIAFAMTATVLVALVLVPLLGRVRALGWIPDGHWLGYTIDPAMLAILGAYLGAALRRVYTMSWRAVGITAAVIVGAGVPAVAMGYRFVLFVVALWTTDVTAV